jgi:hypothetical protein
MTERGYDADFAVGVTAASSIIGPVFPPTTDGPVGNRDRNLHRGPVSGRNGRRGTHGAFMFVTVYILAKRKNYYVNPQSVALEILRSFADSFHRPFNAWHSDYTD